MATSATSSRKIVLDEDSFQKLLAAAFVVQEHNDRKGRENEQPKEPAKADLLVPVASSAEESSDFVEQGSAYGYAMDEIVATQHQIQTRRLELKQALDLIVQRVSPIAHADGAAIALLEQESLIYHSAVGLSAPQTARRVKIEASLCAESIRNGTTLQCADATADFRLDPRICAERRAQGIICVPVYRDERIAGALEIVFRRKGSFGDHDVRTCQLMAGLVTEVLDRASDQERKEALAAERATMLEALEKLKPQLQRLVEAPDTTHLCTTCGNSLAENETHCSNCGANHEAPASKDTQGRLASMIRMGANGSATSAENDARVEGDRTRINRDQARSAQPASGTTSSPPSQNPSKPLPSSSDSFAIPSSVIDELEARIREFDPDRLVVSSTEPHPIEANDVNYESSENDDAEGQSDALTIGTPPVEDAGELRIAPASTDATTWTSAATAKEWLESVTDPRSRTALARFLKHRRAEIYLSCAVLLVAFAVWWSIRDGGAPTSDSVNPTTAADGTAPGNRRRVKPPDADLSMFDKLLVAIGLAEAPPAPAYLGNPDTKVWVDLQTALYYCPNADLYGKTPKGKFTTQRDAQMDQFEPAYRRACD